MPKTATRRNRTRKTSRKSSARKEVDDLALQDDSRMPKPPAKVHWEPMPLVESLLDAAALDYEVREIPLKQIDFSASRTVQSRMEFIVDETYVKELASGIRDGVPLFYVVLYQKSPRRFIIWDGLHRLSACQRLGIKQCMAYVVTTKATPETQLALDMVPRRINNLANGQRAGLAQARATVIYGYERYNLSPDALQKWTGLSRSAVYNILKSHTAKKEISRLMGANFDELSDEACRNLASLIDNKRVASAAISVAAKHRLTGDQARSLVQQIRSAPNESEKMKIIEMFERALVDTGKSRRVESKPLASRRRINPIVSSVRNLYNLLRGYDKPRISDFPFTMAEVEMLQEEGPIVVEKLKCLLGVR